jgi:hypothetical protein
LIQDLRVRGQKLETLPADFWTDAAHRILLYPVLSDCLAVEKMPCAS